MKNQELRVYLTRQGYGDSSAKDPVIFLLRDIWTIWSERAVELEKYLLSKGFSSDFSVYGQIRYLKEISKDFKLIFIFDIEKIRWHIELNTRGVVTSGQMTSIPDIAENFASIEEKLRVMHIFGKVF